MAKQNAVTRTLRRAAKASGGGVALAAKLSAPVSEVARWSAGIPPPPDTAVFLAALDIVSAGRPNPPGPGRTRAVKRRKRREAADAKLIAS
jgi:hypothetical protein